MNNFNKFPIPDKDYVVVVAVITYNHAKYIEEALKSIIMQRVSFPIVALVIDDCSNDGTTEIVHRYEHLYPDLIKGFYFEENQSSQGGAFRYAFPWINHAKYIALCEGDDYWTDPLKLQKQVDFMDRNSECTLSFHSVTEHWQDNSAPDKVFFPVEDRIYTGTEIYKQWVVATCSVMIRASVFKNPLLLDMFKDMNFMYYDQAIFMRCAIDGKARGMGDIMAVYRRLNSGYSLQLDKNLKRSFQVIERYCTHCQTMAEVFGNDLGVDFVRECESRFVATAVDGSLLAWANRDFKQAKCFFLRSFHSYAKDTLRLMVSRIFKI